MRSRNSIRGFAVLAILWLAFTSGALYAGDEDALTLPDLEKEMKEAPQQQDQELPKEAATEQSPGASSDTSSAAAPTDDEALGLPTEGAKKPVQPLPEASASQEPTLQPKSSDLSNEKPPTYSSTTGLNTDAPANTAAAGTNDGSAAAAEEAAVRNNANFAEAGDNGFGGGGEVLIDSTEEDAPHHFHLSAMFGVPLVTPSNISLPYYGGFDFQATIDTHLTLGILGIYESSGTDALGTIAATINYYSRRPYEGIWIQFGVGPQFDLVTSGSPVLFPVLFSVGWSWLDDTRNLTFAFSVGPILYPFGSHPNWIPITVNLDIGLAWNVWPH